MPELIRRMIPSSGEASVIENKVGAALGRKGTRFAAREERRHSRVDGEHVRLWHCPFSTLARGDGLPVPTTVNIQGLNQTAEEASVIRAQ